MCAMSTISRHPASSHISRSRGKSNVRAYALAKLENKKLDMIVANRVGEDCGFDQDVNTVEVLWDGGEQAFAQAAKSELARDIIQLVAARYSATRGSDTQPALPRLHAID